jgi:glycosyltransferase involved in cell wall biosynthesis
LIKILFIITGLSTGGAEKMLHKLLQRINRSRFQCRVVSLTDFGSVGQQIENLGIDVIALNFHRRYLIVPGVWRLVSILRNWKPDVASTWLYHADIIGGLAALFTAVPHVIWNVRNSTLIGSGRFKMTKIIVKLCAWLSNVIPDRIIVNSKRARDLHVNLGYTEKKFHVIPNGFDIESFKPNKIASEEIRKQFDIPEDSILIGLFGRYDPQKNHLGFINSAHIVLKKIPDVIFLMVGRNINNANSNLVSQLKSKNIIKNFILADEQSDMPSFYAALDFLCLPSLGESFPNVLGEAMAAGVPCIVSDVGDCAEIIGDGGFVVPPADTESLAKALISAINLSTLDREQLGRIARKKILDTYSIDYIVGQYETLFSQTVENK